MRHAFPVPGNPVTHAWCRVRSSGGRSMVVMWWDFALCDDGFVEMESSVDVLV